MSPPHGTKRAADSALDGEQRLSKRFDLLHLDNAHHGARLYTPVASPHPAPHPLPPHVPRAERPRAPRPPASDDLMHVEDTPHRLYIHDLAAELSDTDSDSDNPVFLSDIEKHLSKIPRHLLLRPPPEPTEHNQMVLYNVPASLTVPEEHDSVRKAIVEARQRIRDQQASAVTEPAAVLHRRLPAAATAPAESEHDADAMDLD